jgi:hypothetical protein
MAAGTTRLIRQKNNAWFTSISLVIAMFVTSANSHGMSKRKEKGQEMSGLESLQSAIQKLRGYHTFTSTQISELFGSKLVETDRNDYFAYFEGKNASFDALKISKVDLRLPVAAQDKSGFLVLHLTGPCIKRQEVFNAYKGLQLSSAPRGRSEDETTNFSVQDGWGRMSFGFAEKNPDCLAIVGLDPKD